METRKGTRGWWLVLGLAAGLGAGCSLRTEIGVVELGGAAGGGEAGDVGGKTAAGGSATGGSAVGGAKPISMSAGGSALVDSGNMQGGTQSTGGPGGTAGTGGTGGGGGNAGEEGNKVVLFDGSPQTFDSWRSVRNGGNNPWTFNDDGTMTVQSNTGDILSEPVFNDVFVHVEYKTPRFISAGGGQERGNSGVYLKGSYELQILDTKGLPPASDGCGAIYGISPPLVSACFADEDWNVYEIEFKAQLCNDQGQKTANARFLEVKLNGMLVQQNVDVPSTTQAGQPESCQPRGVMLQDHSSILPVTFRNIWAIPRN